MRLAATSLAGALCIVALPANADWLTLGSRTIARGDSADPDSPSTGYAFGPRARSTLGIDVALFRTEGESRSSRVGLVGLLAIENANGANVLPSQIGRSLLALGPSWAYRDPLESLLPVGHQLEFGVELGRKTAFTFDQLVLEDPFRSDDVPFGAGGVFISVDGALSSPLGPRAMASSRLTLRSYVNALPDAVGQTEASDHVAAALGEGAELSAAWEVGVRYRLTERAFPVLRFYADLIEPHDDSAKTLWLTRALLGIAFPGTHFEVEPYIDLEAGHGQGLLVNREQVRFGAGARFYGR